MDPPPPYQETALRVEVADEEGTSCCPHSNQNQHGPNSTAAVPVAKLKSKRAPKHSQAPTEAREEGNTPHEVPNPKRRKRDRLLSGLKKCGKKCAKPFVWFGQTKVGRPFAITGLIVARAVKYLVLGVGFVFALMFGVVFLMLAQVVLFLASVLYPEGLKPGQPLRRFKDWL